MTPGWDGVSFLGVEYRLPDGGSSTALDWDGGCDAGTAPSWDVRTMAARLQAVEIEVVRLGSKIQRTEGDWRLEARTGGNSSAPGLDGRRSAQHIHSLTGSEVAVTE